MISSSAPNKISVIISFIKTALKGGEQDFTTGSIRRAVFLLAIPMILEMCMESVFAVVDIFFVSRIGNAAAATVGLTEAFLAIIYSIAIGLSMAATAMVARRVGEKNTEEASRAGVQSILLAILITVVVSIAGVVFARDILTFMGAPAEVLSIGVPYTQVMFGGSIVIMLLFLINGIFRGAGDASIAMRSLWLANICNIILCPVLIFGLGPIPALGLTGAAVATTIGRGTGVIYQLYHLFRGNGVLKIKSNFFVPDFKVIRSILNVSFTAAVQFLITSASWIFLARIISSFGSDAIAGYTIALRVIVFFILPAWGMSNAAATLVGQNLGAKLPDRAEQSVWKTARYNMLFMVCVTLIFLFLAEPVIALFTNQPQVADVAVLALRIVSIGYIGYGLGMVLINAFNGAGDTRTPTIINLCGFWAFQIPLAYFLAKYLELGPKGVFMAIVIAECSITVATLFLFRRGKWKTVRI